uniref:Protein kinase domain-containing protein n=1 Tax=Chrysotila carterae TaxID=13221 RepID=A0A7S4BFL9_CHRCT|mmetsp:Transcript_17576/g.37180  ORF Transcript_17576/g.37180 Transcript_17576/m.37180 type:complete len:372 (+) Transcript_17576:195-1310(+)
MMLLKSFATPRVRGEKSSDRETEIKSMAKAAAHEYGVEEILLPRSSVTLGKAIGQGAFGRVYRCNVSGEKELLVAKSINSVALRKEDQNLFRIELTVWSKLNHPSCIRLIGVCLEGPEYLLICPFCEGGTLAGRHAMLLKKRSPPIATAVLVRQALQVASGMAYLHSQNIMHRDLKSPNILLTAAGDLRISDFGLAKYAPTEKSLLTAETGSYRWMAPEVLRHEPYDRSCDVFSFGMLCWEMLTYSMPFEKLTPVQAAFAVAIDGHRPIIPRFCSTDIAKLLNRCWDKSSEQRPSFDAITLELEAKAKSLSSAVAATAPLAQPERGEAAPAENCEPATTTCGKRSASSGQPATSDMKRPRSVCSELNALAM